MRLQPNPIKVREVYHAPHHYTLEQAIKLRDWLNRVIAWREKQIKDREA